MALASVLGIIAALVLALLAMREAILDFAERQYADATHEPFGDAAYGDVVFIAADDLKSLNFHARVTAMKEQQRVV